MRNFNQPQKNIKKLSLILLGAVSLGLTACNSGSNSPNTNDSANTNNAVSQPSSLQTASTPNTHVAQIPQPSKVVAPTVKYSADNAPVGNLYAPGTSLKLGEAFIIDNGTTSYMLMLQLDGNVVLTKCDDRSCKTGGTVLWATNTDGQGTPDAHLDVQQDGNFVLYPAKGSDNALWAATMENGGHLKPADLGKAYGIFKVDGNFTMWFSSLPSYVWSVFDIRDVQDLNNKVLWSTNVSENVTLHPVQAKITNSTSCPLVVGGYGTKTITIKAGDSGSAEISRAGTLAITEYASTTGKTDCSHAIATTSTILVQSGSVGDHMATVTASQSALTEKASTPYTAKFTLNGKSVTLSSADATAGQQKSYDKLDYSQPNNLTLEVGGTGTVDSNIPPVYPSTATAHIVNNTGCLMMIDGKNIPADGQEYSFATASGSSNITEAGDLGFIDSKTGLFVKTQDCANVTNAHITVTAGSGMTVSQTQFTNYATADDYNNPGFAPHAYLSVFPSAYGSSFIGSNGDSVEQLFSDRSNQTATYSFTSDAQKKTPELSLTFDQYLAHSDASVYVPQPIVATIKNTSKCPIGVATTGGKVVSIPAGEARNTTVTNNGTLSVTEYGSYSDGSSACSLTVGSATMTLSNVSGSRYATITASQSKPTYADSTGAMSQAISFNNQSYTLSSADRDAGTSKSYSQADLYGTQANTLNINIGGEIAVNNLTPTPTPTPTINPSVKDNGEWVAKEYDVVWSPSVLYPMVSHRGHEWVACSNASAQQEPGSTTVWTPWVQYDDQAQPVPCN